MTNSQLNTIARINNTLDRLSHAKGNYTVKDIKDAPNGIITAWVQGADENSILDTSFFIEIGKRGAVTVLACNFFTIGTLHHRWEMQKVHCQLFINTLGFGKIDLLDREPEKVAEDFEKETEEAQEEVTTEAVEETTETEEEETMNDNKLNEVANDIAQEAFEMYKNGVPDYEAEDFICESVDGSEWVIYYYKAHQVCQNCNTDQGAQWLEDCGLTGESYDDYATKLAYGELYVRASDALSELIEAYEPEEDEA